MKTFCFFIILLLQPLFLISQEFQLLPEHNLWEVQSLDPLASQVYGHIAKVWEGDEAADYAVAGFAFGFQRGILRWEYKNGNSLEIGMEGYAITQFEFTSREKKFQRNILSTDYLAGVPLLFRTGHYTFRFRLYHLSAHTGDDYMVRNGITSYYKNNNNYEQADLTVMYKNQSFSFLAGFGAVVRVYEPRKPLYIMAGINYSYPLKWRYNTRFYAGIYTDSRQDHNFRPAIHIGSGIQVGDDTKRSFKILITYFNGPLPYSVYIGEPRQWLGAAFYFNPF